MKNNQILLKYIPASLGILSLGLFGLYGSALSVYAQSTANTTQNVIAHDFKNDVEQGVQEVNNDKEAKNNQQEIDNEDQEGAGDEHGDVKEVDGENNQSEIDNEIEQDIEQEDANQVQGQGDSEGQSGTENNTNSSAETASPSGSSGN